jgi:hypothetical protein
MTKINYQQIYEDEVADNIKTSLEKPTRFFELSDGERSLFEELVDAGYRRAVEDNLDAEVLADTIAVSDEMCVHLTQFANMLRTLTGKRPETEDDV